MSVITMSGLLDMYSLSVWIGMCRLVHVALEDLPGKVRCHVVVLEDLLRLRQRFFHSFSFIIILFYCSERSTRIFKSDEKLRSVSPYYSAVFFVIVRGGN